MGEFWLERGVFFDVRRVSDDEIEGEMLRPVIEPRCAGEMDAGGDRVKAGVTACEGEGGRTDVACPAFDMGASVGDGDGQAAAAGAKISDAVGEGMDFEPRDGEVGELLCLGARDQGSGCELDAHASEVNETQDVLKREATRAAIDQCKVAARDMWRDQSIRKERESFSNDELEEPTRLLRGVRDVGCTKLCRGEREEGRQRVRHKQQTRRSRRV